MTPHIPGSVEVICGSMFSGKTDELIRRLRRATIARQHVQVFKPAIDMRYAVEKVTSHAGSDFDAIPIGKAAEIRNRLDSQATVVAIDEAQFFDNEIIQVVEELADKKLRVIVAGLDMMLEICSIFFSPPCRQMALTVMSRIPISGASGESITILPEFSATWARVLGP